MFPEYRMTPLGWVGWNTTWNVDWAAMLEEVVNSRYEDPLKLGVVGITVWEG